MSNFAMGTILGKDFPQALVHTVHSTCACGKPFPMIVPMAKLDILTFPISQYSHFRKLQIHIYDGKKTCQNSRKVAVFFMFKL